METSSTKSKQTVGDIVNLGKDSTGKMSYGKIESVEGDKVKVKMEGGGSVTLSYKDLEDSAKESVKDEAHVLCSSAGNESEEDAKQNPESKKQTVGDLRAAIVAKIKTFSDQELLEEAAKHKASDIIDHERWMLANDAFAEEIKLRNNA